MGRVSPRRYSRSAWAWSGRTTLGLAGNLQAAYRVGSFEPIRQKLNEIVRRRNEIVHEGDLAVHERGGRVKRKLIEHAFVDDALKFLEALVSHLEGI